MEVVYMLSAIPFFFLLMGIEWYVGKRSQKRFYRFNDSVTNLNIGIGQQATNLFIKAFLVGLFVYLYEELALLQIPVSWWSVILCMLVFDFLFYWAHRWSHEINFLWGAHVVHHSSEEYNLSVALRQSWFHAMIAFFIFIPMPLLGFQPELFFSVAVIHTLYQFWIHTEAIDRMPRWFEAVFNSPMHHRVHHGRNPKYLDKNHAGMFIIWDRLFGTYKEEEEAPAYGITTPLKSFNPGWANLHYYHEMWQVIKRTKSLKDKLKMIVARPGWLPDELGGFQEPAEVDRQKAAKYDTATAFHLNAYVAVQFVLIVSGLVAFMFHFETIHHLFKWIFLAIIVLSTMICGAILENKNWVWLAEYSRLLLALAALNSFYYVWYQNWFSLMLICSVTFAVVLGIWFTISWFFKPHQAEGNL